MRTTIFFDLDDTLYPRSCGLMAEISRRIQQFVETALGVSAERAAELRHHWRLTYGTALRGMTQEGYDFDREEFFRFVHDIPLEGVLQPDRDVRAMLLGLQLRRAILTNSNVEHAQRILAHLDLADCFERIVDIRALDYENKPTPRAYLRACELMGVSPTECIFVEDSPVNTASAMALGMATVLVDCPPSHHADYFVQRVVEVGGVVQTELARANGRVALDSGTTVSFSVDGELEPDE